MAQIDDFWNIFDTATRMPPRVHVLTQTTSSHKTDGFDYVIDIRMRQYFEFYFVMRTTSYDLFFESCT